MRNLLILICILLPPTLFAQSLSQKYSRVKVLLHETDISELAELGLEYDHGVIAKGRYWINDISARELALLQENNFQYEILVEDLQAWYIEQNKLPIENKASARNNQVCGAIDLTSLYNTPENYTYGSMGGYHTFTELLAVLDTMHARFPNLISQKQAIGNYLTQEGRPIYWLKVGNNPTVNEDKPAILYNALHHAREPNSLAQMLFFIWHLLENYETDAEIKYIMDQVEMYFIPCINPDGYVFNERTNPGGGGFWRKNRWVNEMGDTMGVDLNRNYGFQWGLNDAGSSADQFSELYRGPAPFSEPELQAVRDFCVQHQFKIALNYHSFSNLLIIPWGFDNTLTPDDASYRALANKMTEQNQYTIGTGLETVGYLVNGDSDDWMYGEQETKPKILSMTPEVGPGLYGFWPPASAIDQLNKENLWQNIAAAALLKPYGEVVDNNPATLDKAIGNLTFSLQNIGLEAGDLSVSVLSNSENLILNSEPQTFSLAHLASDIFVVNYVISDESIISQTLDFEIIINNGLVERKSTISKKYFSGNFESIFVDNVGTTLDKWSATEKWGTTNQTFFSADNSITDSPDGNYSDMSSSFVQTNEAIDLSEAASALLKFRGKWGLETNFDYVQLLISTDLENFTPLCGNYTVLNGRNQPAYNGFQNDWVLEEIDLEDYLGQPVYFRFQLDSDDFVNADGFYFDDFSIEIIKKETTTSVSNESTILEKNALHLNPNPFTNSFSIQFILTEKAPSLSLTLSNVLGQEVGQKNLKNLLQGTNTIQWNHLKLDNGLYFLKLQGTDNQSITKSILRLE